METVANEIASEIDDILRELLRAAGAVAAQVLRTDEPATLADEDAGNGVRRVPVADGMDLVVLIDDETASDLTAALDRTVRALRAGMKRWGVHELPAQMLIGRVRHSRAALIRRATRLLDALTKANQAVAGVLLRSRDTVAEAGELDEGRRARLDFLRKQVDADAERRRGRSSHGELAGPDVYARSFWFDAYVVLFFAEPYGVDFVRHRVLMVTRELAVILPHLDDEPPTEVATQPPPS